MEDDEFDDTVIVPRGVRQPRGSVPDEDTVLRERPRDLPAPAPGGGAPPPESAGRPGTVAGPRAPIAPDLVTPPALVAPPDGAGERRARDRRDRNDRLDPLEPPRHESDGPRAAAIWYRLSLDGAGPISLETPVLVGRDPRPPRVATGAAPRLIAVRSPLREVSATHLELRQDGASVIVTDMRSTNGTVITMPGLRAFTLHAGDSLVAVPGTLLNIGDSHVIEILPVPRPYTHDQEPFERLST